MQKAELIALIKEAVKEELSQTGLPKSDIFNEKLVTIAELATFLKVTKQTIYNWEKKRYIIPRRIGGRVLYDWREVKASIEKSYLGNRTGRYSSKFNAIVAEKEKLNRA